MWQLTSNPPVDVGHRPPQNGVQKQIVQLVLPNIHHQPEREKKNCKIIIFGHSEHHSPKFEKDAFEEGCMNRTI